MDNLIRVPTRQYQKKNVENTNIRSYQYIQEKLGIDDSFVLFLVSVLIGKSLEEDKIPMELPTPNETYTRDTYHQNKLYFNILKAVAVDVTNDISILNDMKSMIEIWERYACAGFDELCDWYYDSDIDSKLHETLLKSLNMYIGDFKE